MVVFMHYTLKHPLQLPGQITYNRKTDLHRNNDLVRIERSDFTNESSEQDEQREYKKELDVIKPNYLCLNQRYKALAKVQAKSLEDRNVVDC